MAPGASAGGGREPSRVLGEMAMVLRDPAALHFLLHQARMRLQCCKAHLYVMCEPCQPQALPGAGREADRAA